MSVMYRYLMHIVLSEVVAQNEFVVWQIYNCFTFSVTEKFENCANFELVIKNFLVLTANKTACVTIIISLVT